MEEKFRSRLLIVLVVLNVIFLLLWASSCNTISRYQSARNQEMDKRLDAEKGFEELKKAKVSLEEKLKKFQDDSNQERLTHETTEKALVQERLVSNSLKNELEKISKLKEALEQELKDVLTRCKVPAADKSKK